MIDGSSMKNALIRSVAHHMSVPWFERAGRVLLTNSRLPAPLVAYLHRDAVFDRNLLGRLGGCSALRDLRNISMTAAKSFMKPSLAVTPWAREPTIRSLPKSAEADLA
jgi:hypothetical protein